MLRIPAGSAGPVRSSVNQFTTGCFMSSDRICTTCHGPIEKMWTHRTCCNACRRVQENAYRQRIVRAQCPVCLEFRYCTYGQMAASRSRRGGSCNRCPVVKGMSFKWEEHSPPIEEDPDIEWKQAACGSCKYGKIEAQSFLGYDCTISSAVICQPRSHQRLYTPAWR
jgi:hypothetical protein